MKSKRWQKKLARIEMITQELSCSLPGHDPKKVLQHLQMLNAIAQYENTIADIIDELGLLKEQHSSLHPKTQSILYWGIECIKQFLNIYEKTCQLNGTLLWLNLLFGKFKKQGKHPARSRYASILDIEALNLGTHELALRNKEKSLIQELLQLQSQKAELQKEYAASQAKLSNQEAGQILQRNSGETPTEWEKGHRSFKKILTNMSSVTRSSTIEEKKYQKLRSRLVRQTNDLMKDCKTLLSSDINGQKNVSQSSTTLSHLEASLESLELLREQVSEAHLTLRRTPPPEMRPIMVKQSRKSGKRVSSKKSPMSKYAKGVEP